MTKQLIERNIMENQHRKIAGYRELTQEEIDLMNRIKAFGPELQTLCDDLQKHIINQEIEECYDERNRLAEPLEWLDQGKMSLQKGLMFLTRSVAQPSFF
jgi:hypothetical protein